MLTPGSPAPDFAIPPSPQAGASTGSPSTLHAWCRGGPVLVYFYPADFTPVCTKQACTMRDAVPSLPGVQVVGVSPQSASSHERFAQKHGLPFPLVADTDKAIARAFGVTGPFGLGIRRSTFLIGTDGRIVDAVRADLALARHVALLDRARDLATQAPSAPNA